MIFVPVGNYYKKNGLIDAKHRYNMLKLCVEGKLEFDVENMLVEAKTTLYAIDTFELIKQKYSKDDKFFIMGSDNYRKISTWKNYEELINKNNIIVVKRDRKKTSVENRKNIIEFIPEQLAEIDSTKIRKMISNTEEEPKKYLNSKVYEYIKKNKLYM